ncbi:MAG: FkbM family methyltransferase [Deltaproteobacteria bacterium]|nr:FkbM family methyltransferase [Deltaproteobacteria bacterium]
MNQESHDSDPVTPHPTEASPPSFNEHRIILDYFREHPRRAGVMLDVGAMEGSSSRAFAKLGWEIYAFEPDPRQDLRSDPDFSDKARIHISNAAVSDQPSGKVPFFASPESRGVSTLKPFLESHQETGKVEVTTLSEVVQSQKIKKIDYLKIDTEGFDLKVLEGFPWRRGGLDRLGKSRWPEVILCEFDDSKSCQQGYDHEDLGRALEQRGYEVYLCEWSPIQEYGQPHSWVAVRRFPCEPPADKAWGNFLAVSPGGHPKTLRRLILEAVLSDRAKVQESLSNREHNLPTLLAALDSREEAILERNAALDQKNEALVRQREALEKRNAGMEERLQAIRELREALAKEREVLAKREEGADRLKEALIAREEGLDRLREALAERNAGMETRLTSIQDLKEAIGKRDQTIAQLKTALIQKEEGLERLQKALTERNSGMEKRLSDIHHLKEAVAKRDETIKRLKEVLPQKDKGLERLRTALTERTNNIESLREALARRDAALAEFKEKLLARDADIERLQKALTSQQDSNAIGP